MKNSDIDISQINSAIENAGNEFTISQLMKSIGNKSTAFSNRLARILDGDDRFFSLNDSFVRRDFFFAGAKFLITPDSWEICEKILIPGHRFIAFTDRELFPSDAELFWNGKAVPKREITAPLGKLFHYHTLLGSETVFDHLIAESPANEHLMHSVTATSQVTLTVFDLAGIIDDFSDGDALLAELTDYSTGKINISVLDGAKRQNQLKREWINSMDEAVEKVIDRFEEYLDIPDQLAWAVYYAGKSALSANASIDEFIRASKKVEIKADGDHAVLGLIGSTSDSENDNDETQDVFSLSKGALDPAKMFRELGSILSTIEIDSFILDCCYARETDFDDFFRRIFGEVTPEYADDAQKAALLNYLEEKFEEAFSTYNRADDEPKAELRSMILEAVTDRMEFMRATASLEQLPDEKIMRDIAAVAHQLEHILGALNSPGFTPDDTELRQLADRAEELIDEQETLSSKILKQ